MTRYIIRRLLTLLGTMIVISILVFGIIEVAPGNVVRNILGARITPEQERSMANQLGFDRPVFIRYVSWLLGTDWQAQRTVGLPLREIVVSEGLVERHREWWAVDRDGRLVQWDMVGGHLVKLVRNADGTVTEVPDDQAWGVDERGRQFFWGVDTDNRAALWIRGEGGVEYTLTFVGWQESHDSPVDYVPLTRGLLRGDAGISLIYKRPVVDVITRKVTNSAILAGLAFIVAMPVSIVLGLIAGLNQGKLIDRVLSIGGLVTTATPDFATGILLVAVFAIWLKLLPGVTAFSSDEALLRQPQMLILPVLTIALMEVGYVLRITRASVLSVMNSSYVRTAVLKGLPYWQVILRHVLRNALMAPVTVIMLHVNWLIGGLVVVETVFGYPGIGNFILNAALYKDIYSTEAATMVMIVLAVGTQLIADILYAFLNPRIRYA